MHECCCCTLTHLQALEGTAVKLDCAVSLSFTQHHVNDGATRAAPAAERQVEYLLALFNRSNLRSNFPNVSGTEFFSNYALEGRGTVSFNCAVEKAVLSSLGHKALSLALNESVRVKVYPYIIHVLKSYGSLFKFKDTDLATAKTVKDVFASFLAMSERIVSWGRDGILHARAWEQPIDASKFQKSLSTLRVEATFVLDVPKRFKWREILSSIEDLLLVNLQVLFGSAPVAGGDREHRFLMDTLEFLPVTTWLQQVEETRTMLQRPELSLGTAIGTSTLRGKHQAQLLQSLLGYCCKKTTAVVNHYPWANVWAANARSEYPGMQEETEILDCVCVCDHVLLSLSLSWRLISAHCCCVVGIRICWCECLGVSAFCIFAHYTIHLHNHTELKSTWEQQYDWYDPKFTKIRKDINRDEWQHVRWFYDNCNWRNASKFGQFAVTGIKHGGQQGAADTPCETLYVLLLNLRDMPAPSGEEEQWESVYAEIVKPKHLVTHKKGHQLKLKPEIINWP